MPPASAVICAVRHPQRGRGPAPSLSAAAARNSARACAHAWRSAEPESSMDRLPEVTPSSGLVPVVTGGHPDLVQVHVEFLGRDLGQRRPDALAVLDLARAGS